MTDKISFSYLCKIFAICSASILILLSIFNLIMWYAHPPFITGTYVSGICFIVAGIAMLYLYTPWHFPLHRVLGGLLVLCALFFLISHMQNLKINWWVYVLGFNNLQGYRFPFELSPISSLAFVFSGLALVFFSKNRSLCCSTTVIVFSFLSFCMGFAGVLRYYFPLDSFFGIRNLPESAPLVGVGSMLLGLGIAASRTFYDAKQKIDTHRWDYLLAFFFAFFLTNLVYAQLKQHEARIGQGFLNMLWINGFVFSILLGGLFFLWRKAQIENLKLKETKTELQTNREILDFALAAAEVGVWRWDIVKDEVVWNERMYAMYGVQKHQFHGTYAEIVAFVHPQDREYFHKQVQNTLERGIPFGIEYRICWPDNTMREVLARGKLQYDQDGKPVLLSGLCWDISEKKRNERFAQAEHTILQTINDYPSLQEAIPHILLSMLQPMAGDFIACWMLNRKEQKLEYSGIARWESTQDEGLESEINRHVFKKNESLPGYIWNSLQPLWIPDMSADRRFAPFLGKNAAHIKGIFGFPIVNQGIFEGVMVIFYQHILPKEPESDLLNWATIIGSKLGVFANRKRMEAELEESEKRFHTFLEYTQAWVWAVDINLKVIYCNQSIKDVLGYLPDEVVGQNIITFALEEEQEKKREFFNEHFTEKEGWKKVLTKWKHKDGSIRWVDSSAAILEDKEGHFTGFMGADRDITEEINFEEKKREFLSKINHELRNPLTSIRGSLGLLKKEGQTFSEEISELLGIAYRNAERLSHILDQIVDLDKMQKMKPVLDLQPISIAKLFDEANAYFKTIVREKPAHLIVHKPQEAIFVLGDFDRLVQVLINFISNAYKASPAGENIELRCEKRENTVCISVHNIGEVIPESFQSHIFKKMINHEASQLKYGGMGLGLIICKDIIDLHGGKIYFESTKEKGTTFSFELTVIEHAEQST